MTRMETLPRGFRIGHWSDPRARTGCTVILCPPATVGSCDVRGSSPGTREVALLAVDKRMQEVHALLLTGGSAFGLAAADGVMRWCEEQSIGYLTPFGRVPIVPAAVIFDLNVGSPAVRPGAEAGYAAASSASAEDFSEGLVGAGTGASVGKWGGMEGRMDGGLGFWAEQAGGATVAALAVVNAVGDVVDERGNIIAGARMPDGTWRARAGEPRSLRNRPVQPGTHTTLVAILTDAKLSKVDANRAAQRGHDGMARAITPVHTSYDGDAVFCLASGTVNADYDLIAEAGADAVARAIRRAATSGR
jgi:L-aminopeptidase/D-esterase-like protein